MGAERSAAPRGSTYVSRRPYVVAESLDDLAGPTGGTVRLSSRLDWSGQPSYDLTERGNLIAMYQAVLNEATDSVDLTRWLHGPTLIRLWPDLWLSPRLRGLWESRFPELAAARCLAGR
jgi:hypothetical protein